MKSERSTYSTLRLLFELLCCLQSLYQPEQKKNINSTEQNTLQYEQNTVEFCKHK